MSGERLQDHWSSGFICENKDADHSNSGVADQHLLFSFYR